MDLIQKKEAEKFADEIFEGLKKNLEASKSDTEAKKEIVKSSQDLFSTAKFKKVDKKRYLLISALRRNGIQTWMWRRGQPGAIPR